MIYQLAADAVLMLHLLFIVFVVAGALLAIRWHWILCVHLPAVAWGIWVEATATICPLTPLENMLRHAAGEAGYRGGFVEHYLINVIYPPGLTAAVQLWLAVGVVVINVLLYGIVMIRIRRQQKL